MIRTIFLTMLGLSLYAAQPTKEDYLRAQLKASNTGIKYQGLLLQLREVEKELNDANKIVAEFTTELSKSCKATEVFNANTVVCETKPQVKEPSGDSK